MLFIAYFIGGPQDGGQAVFSGEKIPDTLTWAAQEINNTTLEVVNERNYIYRFSCVVIRDGEEMFSFEYEGIKT